MTRADKQSSELGHKVSGFRSSIGTNLLCDLDQGPLSSVSQFSYV